MSVCAQEIFGGLSVLYWDYVRPVQSAAAKLIRDVSERRRMEDSQYRTPDGQQGSAGRRRGGERRDEDRVHRRLSHFGSLVHDKGRMKHVTYLCPYTEIPTYNMASKRTD